jgi:hypothetical protein
MPQKRAPGKSPASLREHPLRRLVLDDNLCRSAANEPCIPLPIKETYTPPKSPIFPKRDLLTLPLQTLPDVIGCLPALRELSCDNNRLAEVPRVLATGTMCNLILLSLAGNRISVVEPWASCLVGLKSLYLQV